jgi:hypothetical protein
VVGLGRKETERREKQSLSLSLFCFSVFGGFNRSPEDIDRGEEQKGRG